MISLQQKIKRRIYQKNKDRWDCGEIATGLFDDQKRGSGSLTLPVSLNTGTFKKGRLCSSFFTEVQSAIPVVIIAVE